MIIVTIIATTETNTRAAPIRLHLQKYIVVVVIVVIIMIIIVVAVHDS